jgi:hypothetical protein
MISLVKTGLMPRIRIHKGKIRGVRNEEAQIRLGEE